MIPEEQRSIFDTVVDIIFQSGMNKHMLVVGSWAEYLYEENSILDPSYVSAMKTRDIDFLLRNKNVPRQKTSFFEKMLQSGFEIETSRITGINKFVNEESGMEIEFLLNEIGQGQSEGYKVESLGIKAIGLRHLNIIGNNSITTEYNGVELLIPSPEAYALHKLVINNDRSAEKKEKDLYAVQNILEYIVDNQERCESFSYIKSTLTTKELKFLEKTVNSYHWLQEAISKISEKDRAKTRPHEKETIQNELNQFKGKDPASGKMIREAAIGILYSGKIIAITEKHVLQNIGKQNVVAHDIKFFDKKPEVGEDLSIRHTKQKITIKTNEK